MKFILLPAILLLSLIVNPLSGKDQDTLKTYRLGEIEIKDKKEEKSVLKKSTITELPYYKIQNSDVISLSELQYLLPSANVRTNSRGESMLFVRGAGERQLGLFFDGVSMNIPWDNRLDLTFVPADIIGNIRINKSSNSIFYGANVLGGAISIATLERTNPGYGLTVKLQAGDGNSKNMSILHDGKIGNFNYIANISYLMTDGIILSANAPDSMGNQGNSSSLRSNTDQERLNTYLRGEYKFGNSTTLGLSFSYTSQNKGVAPETYAGEDARFWRFPERDRMIIAINGEHVFSEDFLLKATFWYDMFTQQINAYKSFSYTEIDETQNDDDKTMGTRLSLNYFLNSENRLSFVLNGFLTAHNQSKNEGVKTEFSQNTMSTGLEYMGSFGNLEIGAGAGFDYNETPKTGLFTEAEGESKSDFAGFLSLKYALTDEMAVAAGASRRTRFPTMREQYDEAIGSFITNPGLKPETGLLADLGFIYSIENLTLKLTGFYNSYEGLIERIRLSKEQDSLRRRMRVNYSDASIAGIDFNISYSPIDNFLVEGFFTWMSIEAEQDGNEIEHLVQKPEALGGLSLSYKFDFGLKPQFEIEYTGRQFDSDPETNGGFLELEPALILNFRLGYAFNISGFAYSEVFVRLNNILDEYKLSQWGLPMAGRTLYAGVTVRL